MQINENYEKFAYSNSNRNTRIITENHISIFKKNAFYFLYTSYKITNLHTVYLCLSKKTAIIL